ncbi:MAG: gfo/Idh/MocA family oxidoreductase [Acidobacteria bacterium]|nr:MAG: gfo/Idh/MocA family oxidoreductase [Acidobacteriota bacterium]REK05942.1 MAG: gfo/Idh/MocA family oxidoreductase [Acidobacteriota bacterium]
MARQNRKHVPEEQQGREEPIDTSCEAPLCEDPLETAPPQIAAGAATGPSRRTVLGLGAAALGWTIVPRRVLGRGYQAPSDTLNIAAIGAGGKGYTDISSCEHENVVALCDIDFKRAARAVELFPDAARYGDFRAMLDAEPGIDAVTISTPDHLHAFQALEAIARGKHVFCQKPLTRTIEECQALMKAAAASDVVTQMGNQGHADEGTRLIREWLEAGLIGDVDRIEYWTNRPIWPQALERPTEMHAVPAHVDWQSWLGPAPDRPYHPDYYHPFNWRGWWDFGTGALGDIACHSMDAGFWTYDLRGPTTVVAETTKLFEETAPAACRITYEFPATASRGPITVVWRDGELSPPNHPLFDGDEWPTLVSGQMFVGSKGLLIADIYGNRPQLYPKALAEKVEAEPVPEKYPRTEGIYKEWTEACKGNGKSGSDIATHAGPLTEMALLGNLAVRSREIVRWDAAKNSAGSEAADRFLKADYRDGWSLPG